MSENSTYFDRVTDYYQLLQIPRNSDQAAVKQAYRKQALRFHPDKNTSKNAKTIFTKITQAYEVLSDPAERKTYDDKRNQPKKTQYTSRTSFNSSTRFGFAERESQYKKQTTGPHYTFRQSDPNKTREKSDSQQYESFKRAYRNVYEEFMFRERMNNLNKKSSDKNNKRRQSPPSNANQSQSSQQNFTSKKYEKQSYTKRYSNQVKKNQNKGLQGLLMLFMLGLMVYFMPRLFRHGSVRRAQIYALRPSQRFPNKMFTEVIGADFYVGRGYLEVIKRGGKSRKEQIDRKVDKIFLDNLEKQCQKRHQEKQHYLDLAKNVKKDAEARQKGISKKQYLQMSQNVDMSGCARREYLQNIHGDYIATLL